MSEQELLRTALVLPPRARRVLCVWAAVPGLVCAPFAFWQSVWAGQSFALYGRRWWRLSGRAAAALSPP